MWIAIKLVASQVWSFLLPFVKLLMTKAGQLLAVAATDAVKQIANDTSIISDSQKRQAAFNLIVTDLQAQGVKVGVDVGTSLVNAAIEVAIQRLKA